LKIGTTYRFWKLFLFMGATFLLSNCGRIISPDNPIRREKIGEGASRKIMVEDKFSWTQAFTKISAHTPDGEQQFRVQIRSKQDSILWAAISDDMIGLRVGKAIVIGDSAAFTSTLLGMEWTGSAADLATITGIDVPFEYLNKLLRGQLIGAEPTMRYRFKNASDTWVTKYSLSLGRKVTASLDQNLRMRHMTIEDKNEIVNIDYTKVDVRTGYPAEMVVTLQSKPEYRVLIEITEIRTEGPYNTPFSL
tara:strand:+ start:1212 stop:1958 length:747 start_codon:yes stop_codon:yes gene_type:complete